MNTSSTHAPTITEARDVGWRISFADLGVNIIVGRNEPDAGGYQQPVVSIGTEEFASKDRYDAATGMHGTDEVYVVTEVSREVNAALGSNDGNRFFVEGHGEVITAPLSKLDAETICEAMNSKWEEQCGMPIINVLLNDATIYDDEGEGDHSDAGKWRQLMQAYTDDDESIGSVLSRAGLVEVER